MNLLDLAILALLASSVAGGWQLGLMVGSTAWVLLAQGLVVATLTLPEIDRALRHTSPGTSLALEAFFFVGTGFACLYAGRTMGQVFRSWLLPVGRHRRDKVAGAIGGPVAVLTLVWVLALPAMTQAPGWFSREAHRSLLARGIDDVLPAPPDTARAFHRLAGPAGMPQVFASLDPLLDRVAPPRDPGLGPALVSRVSASTVKVDGVACSYRREGSGFTVGIDTVVTNAHVVAGEDSTSVVRPDGRRLAATVTAYDPDRDLAVLRVAGLGEPALPIAAPETRTTAAVFGHPGGQAALKVSPALIRREVTAHGYDLYGAHGTSRDVLVLAADLRPGDSGAALVNIRGTVVGVAFAISTSTADTAYALSTDELRPVLAANTSQRVDTGDCLL